MSFRSISLEKNSTDYHSLREIRISSDGQLYPEEDSVHPEKLSHDVVTGNHDMAATVSNGDSIHLDKLQTREGIQHENELAWNTRATFAAIVPDREIGGETSYNVFKNKNPEVSGVSPGTLVAISQV